ncbi:MAG TPA: MCP four helix bundle domain-containing protein, partial [Alphaproteobacteria bacterium]|nr:MCP four helix bundle domain-containing protein [Alphaproteobacteria bacterium]
MLKHSKIIQRLAALLLINIVLMGGLGGLGYLGMSSIREGLRSVYEDRTVPMGQILTSMEEYYEIRLAVLAGVGATDPAVVAQKKADTQERKARIEKEWKAYMATYLTPEEAEAAKTTEANIAAYDAVWPQVLEKAAAGDQMGAKELASSKGGPAFKALSESFNALAELQKKIAGDVYTDATNTFNNNLYLLIAILIGAVALGAVLAMVVARSITLPLNGIIGVMGELTKGNLGVEVDGQDRRDEVGSVAKAVGVFKNGLVEAERLRQQQQAEQERQIERGKRMEAAVTAFDRMITEVVGSVSSAATELQSTAQSLSATAEETSQQSNA